MSEIKGARPAIIIPTEHQSAPKETPEDRLVREAMEDIETGRFVPKPVEDDILDDETEILYQHPKVQEAMAMLERKRGEASNTQEYLEKAQQLYELNVEISKRDRWDGQGRWIGRENEEMRYGLILTPFQFLDRLENVIGRGRIFVNRFAVRGRVALLTPDRTENKRILLPGEQPKSESGMLQCGTLQWPCSTEWMIMRFDEYGVPTEPKFLGWRTALLSLIQLDLISEKEAHKAFPLGSGPAGDWYREQLYMLRAERGTVQ